MSTHPKQPIRQRPIAVGPVRAFEAVARLASFRAAADELHLTQSAISRQIQALEEDVGAALFTRGTRHVELTSEGTRLLRSVDPWLGRLDAAVRQIREQHARRRVNLTTFASFASLWLLPRIEAFQSQHPDIDIRVSAHDMLADMEDPELDLALRYINPSQAPAGAVRLFGDLLTPVASRELIAQIRRGEAPPLDQPADLAQHTLAEEDDTKASTEYLSWRYWLIQNGQPDLQPRRWLYLNFTYQQVQAVLAGRGIALARIPLVVDALARGELVELFGPERRTASPYAYWLVAPADKRSRPEVDEFCQWVEAEAQRTSAALGQA